VLADPGIRFSNMGAQVRYKKSAKREHVVALIFPPQPAQT
jgi:hypothetical protein